METGATEELEYSSLFAVTVRRDAPILLNPIVNGVVLEMELDTGALLSLASEKTWEGVFHRCPLEKCNTLLRTYTGEPLPVLGQMEVNIQYEDQEATLPLLIVPGNGPPLWGRNWLTSIRLHWRDIKTVSLGVEPLLDQYSSLFSEELGTLKDVQVKLSVSKDAVPKFTRPRPVPYALRGAIERDLERLEMLEVIEKTSFSNWAAPIVAVPKPDGTVRICGDYKVTVNPVLEVQQYPVPKVEDLLATLAGGQKLKFTKLDLSHAYQQVLLSEESRKYVTINTHQGLYRYNRLPFGIASAPAIFQQSMEKILQGIEGVSIDDILVTGRTDKQHLHTLEIVLERLHQYGLRLKRGKCSFMQPSVQYLGYVIDKEGIHTTPEKVQAILNSPIPKDVPQLRSFLGLSNYYGKFIPNLSTITQPLNQLLSSESTIPETVPEVPETLPSVEPRPDVPVGTSPTVSPPEKVLTPDSRPTDVSTESHESSPTSPTPPKRYPKRIRKPPDTLV